MKVITLAKTKELLGISDTSLDASITAKIPYIDAKVKTITKNRFNKMIFGNTISGSPYVEIYSIKNSSGRIYKHVGCGQYQSNNGSYIDDLYEYIETGQLIEGEGIPADTYIDEVYFSGDIHEVSGVTYDVPILKLSNNATATATAERLLLGINQAYQDIIAKGIQYLITGTSTALPQNRLKSKSLPPLSVTYADSKIDPKTGMPDWFISSLPRYMSGH